ncbi:hypothetical protein [Halopseudomonas salegens]|uniref:Uncharacterized protein n=1 Tax=Halopseudomonas salegens TaxID=1434072 RepID=A0A1H2HKP3_9GAMM|nr:hypothetical protein [Halopseudomonas salegens]SDU32447.1 hypothetical protein SAMN05216210_3118 [Halopseudomonas salegens]
MPIELLRYLAYLSFFVFLAVIIWLFIMFVMSFFIPKAMFDKYFKEPYFSRTEIAVFSAFPLNFFRVAMFMRLAGWPSSGKRRGMTEAYLLAPIWFRRISKVMIRILLVLFPSIVVLGLFFALVAVLDT